MDWSDGSLADGLRCYRAGEYFAAHEHWELVWLKSAEPEKTFVQALIQVTAAFEHWRRGEPEGTASLLRRALGRLERYPAEFGGVDVERLRGELRAWVAALAEGETDGLEIPTLHRAHAR